MPIDINVPQLIINKLTKDQYSQAHSDGAIVDTELYLITDDYDECSGDVTADEVTFADGETFQQKYDSGELKGATGATGPAGAGVQSMTYNSSTNKWTVALTDGSSITVDGPAIPDVSGYMPKSGGTFTGSVQAGTAPTDGYYVRNIKFSDTAETPTTDGDVCFKLK